jgi:flagellar hook assembly protein FlgD
LQRLLTSATLVALLVATAAAFAITERLKLTKSAIYGTRVSTTFSPTCGCNRRFANVRIVLRRADTLNVVVIDGHRHEIATVLAGRSFARGVARFRWDGHTSAGAVAPDGAYQVKVHLERQHQTIVLPNPIQLDTKVPQVTDLTKNRDVFSPDQDKQADYVRFSYTLSKPARVLVYLGGRRILKTHRHPVKGAVSWYGRLPDGRLLPPGQYTLSFGALDLAGNVTPPEQRVSVRVQLRYITLASNHIVVRAGKRFEIGVSTDALHYGWQLGARTGRSHGPVLRLTAPQRPGRYTLTVSERGHVNRAAVVVR